MTRENLHNSPEPSNSRQSFFPWWVSLLLALFCYGCFRYLLPALQQTMGISQTLIEIGQSLAPIITSLFLLLAAKQLYDQTIPEDKATPPR